MGHINDNTSNLHPLFHPAAHGPAGEDHFRGSAMMLDDKLVLIRAHRNNVHRYRRLLNTELSSLERQFIERRLAEEKAALDELRAGAFPAAMTVPDGNRPARTEPAMERTHVCQL